MRYDTDYMRTRRQEDEHEVQELRKSQRLYTPPQLKCSRKWRKENTICNQDECSNDIKIHLQVFTSCWQLDFQTSISRWDNIEYNKQANVMGCKSRKTSLYRSKYLPRKDWNWEQAQQIEPVFCKIHFPTWSGDKHVACFRRFSSSQRETYCKQNLLVMKGDWQLAWWMV